MRWLATIAGAALFLVLCTGSGSAQEAKPRMALVIGNSAYQPAWRLENPERDADLIATRLGELGFTVDEVKNAGRAEMESAFRRFGERLRAAGPTAVTVFYYSGHGAQQDGINYLVPVDATARTADELRFQAPPMQFLLDDMAATGNGVNIIILDACRDMALDQGYRALGRGGLADVGRLPNVFIAYATAPGRTAADGDRSNSPFTSALAQELQRQPEQPIALLFGDVQDEVYRATGGAQSPEYRNGLVGASRWSFASSRPALSASAPDSGGARPDSSAPAPLPYVSPQSQSTTGSSPGGAGGRTADGGIYQDFAMSFGPTKAAALDALQNLGLDLKGTQENRDGFIIKFSTPYNFVTAGETGTLLISRVDERTTRVSVSSRGRSLAARAGGPQSGGVGKQQYADRIFFNISRYLSNVHR